jgi:hypothetical protein
VLLVASKPHTPTNRSAEDLGASSRVVHFEDEYAWDSDDDIEDCEDEYAWDSDDDIEEANAADDIIKILEGDW